MGLSQVTAPKHEPVIRDEGRAELGVLIGDPAFRGKQVFAEVLAASTAWLKTHRQIRRAYLGVERENLPRMLCGWYSMFRVFFLCLPSWGLVPA